MNLKNIFRRTATDEVRVPEIEVDGNRLRVQRPEPEFEERPDPRREDPLSEPRVTRELSLPKTKWFT